MAFFPRHFYPNQAPAYNGASGTNGSFTPLFRLLDDYDNYSRQGGSAHGARAAVPTWQPKFDIRETANAYELHGEFPGLVKDNVHIEFTDPQTMQVRGKVERTYTAGTPPFGQVEDSNKTAGAITDDAQEHQEVECKATVEDDDEGEAEAEGQIQEPTGRDNSVVKAQVDKAKYWLTERNIGEFARSFNFPTRVEQEGVVAGLQDGILTVTVPKAKKHEARRIQVN